MQSQNHFLKPNHHKLKLDFLHKKFLKEITGVNMVVTLSFVFMVYTNGCSGMSSLCACFLMCDFVNFDIGGR